ncbi:MAG: peptide ABC transporter substrate-binding protein [Treponema sp.]|jgi:peptide/nickel transport system substrate-binding protein/oligopeptide transport system substrate-binding protein|nr:peptide ABC transporter substrate-binding protein [Treponema sp.]
MIKKFLPKRMYRFSGLVFFCAALLFSCRTSGNGRVDTHEVPPPPEPSRESPGLPEDLPPEPPAGPDGFAEIRPPVTVRDELAVTFTKTELELDFRKSYMASEAQLFTALYEGLFSYHPMTMEPVRGAAEKWELSDDKKQWTFTIRQNARYWTGDTVTAEDFRSAWLSLLDPARESPYSSLFDIIAGAREYRTGALSDPSRVGIEARGEKTLVVTLNAPAGFFPAMLCHHSFSPLHPSMKDKEDWSIVPPIANGPFFIVEQDENKIVLRKNMLYWDAPRVTLNKITIMFTEDGDEATGLWNAGEARWISGDVNLENLTDRSGIMVNPMFATHYYFFRSAEKPWDDYRVRRALSLALPWDKIREGIILPAKTLIYPIRGYPDLEGTETDEAEAVRLLAEAGYEGGKGLPELILRLTPSEEAARIGGLMASTWKEKLGVPVRVEVIPFERYFRSMKENSYAVGSSTWIGDFADPYTFLQMWRRDSNLNDARYSDTDYEALLDRSMYEEGEVRWATLAEAEKLLLDRGEVLPISYTPALNIIDINEIDGWFPNALDIHPFKYLSFRAFRPLPGVASGDARRHQGAGLSRL